MSYLIDRAHEALDQLPLASYITTIDTRHQTIHGIVGDPELVAQYQDSVLPIEQTYCMRMLHGEIPNVVPDTRTHPVLRTWR